MPLPVEFRNPGAIVKSSILAAFCAALFAPGLAASQAYPAKSVRLIVAFPAGGGIDTVTRLLAPKLSDALGQQMVVDNRVGASGNIGTEFVAKSAPDGYTVLMAFSSHASNAALFDKLPFDTVKDFQGVSLIGAVPHILLVNPTMPVKSVAEFVKLAKARPGDINYSTPGNGTPLHLATELFAFVTGTKLTHVPYKGAQPAMVSTIAGETQATITTMVVATPLMKAGRLRGIGVLNAKRLEAFPDIPTVAEAGIKGTESNSWYGMYVPVATPRPVVERLHGAMVKSLQAPDIRQRFNEQTVEVIGSTPEELDRHTRAEIAKWSKVVKASGAKPD
jgi:tripartite-type tricarboxylate transporter receptor subunit TctC